MNNNVFALMIRASQTFEVTPGNVVQSCHEVLALTGASPNRCFWGYSEGNADKASRYYAKYDDFLPLVSTAKNVKSFYLIHGARISRKFEPIRHVCAFLGMEPWHINVVIDEPNPYSFDASQMAAISSCLARSGIGIQKAIIKEFSGARNVNWFSFGVSSSSMSPEEKRRIASRTKHYSEMDKKIWDVFWMNYFSAESLDVVGQEKVIRVFQENGFSLTKDGDNCILTAPISSTDYIQNPALFDEIKERTRAALRKESLLIYEEDIII